MRALWIVALMAAGALAGDCGQTATGTPAPVCVAHPAASGTGIQAVAFSYRGGCQNNDLESTFAVYNGEACGGSAVNPTKEDTGKKCYDFTDRSVVADCSTGTLAVSVQATKCTPDADTAAAAGPCVVLGESGFSYKGDVCTDSQKKVFKDKTCTGEATDYTTTYAQANKLCFNGDNSVSLEIDCSQTTPTFKKSTQPNCASPQTLTEKVVKCLPMTGGYSYAVPVDAAKECDGTTIAADSKYYTDAKCTQEGGTLTDGACITSGSVFYKAVCKNSVLTFEKHVVAQCPAPTPATNYAQCLAGASFSVQPKTALAVCSAGAVVAGTKIHKGTTCQDSPPAATTTGSQGCVDFSDTHFLQITCPASGANVMATAFARVEKDCKKAAGGEAVYYKGATCASGSIDVSSLQLFKTETCGADQKPITSKDADDKCFDDGTDKYVVTCPSDTLTVTKTAGATCKAQGGGGAECSQATLQGGSGGEVVYYTGAKCTGNDVDNIGSLKLFKVAGCSESPINAGTKADDKCFDDGADKYVVACDDSTLTVTKTAGATCNAQAQEQPNCAQIGAESVWHVSTVTCATSGKAYYASEDDCKKTANALQGTGTANCYRAGGSGAATLLIKCDNSGPTVDKANLAATCNAAAPSATTTTTTEASSAPGTTAPSTTTAAPARCVPVVHVNGTNTSFYHEAGVACGAGKAYYKDGSCRMPLFVSGEKAHCYFEQLLDAAERHITCAQNGSDAPVATLQATPCRGCEDTTTVGNIKIRGNCSDEESMEVFLKTDDKCAYPLQKHASGKCHETTIANVSYTFVISCDGDSVYSFQFAKTCDDVVPCHNAGFSRKYNFFYKGCTNESDSVTRLYDSTCNALNPTCYVDSNNKSWTAMCHEDAINMTYVNETCDPTPPAEEEETAAPTTKAGNRDGAAAAAAVMAAVAAVVAALLV